MKRFKYSIIIPHRNCPDLLRRCCDSIPRRDDLQVVVVDDNSDPEKVDFDNFPVSEDERTVVVFDKSGMGAGRARNIALDHAEGEKLIFADADDFFNYCFRDVLEEYRDDTSDIVYFNISSCDSQTYVINTRRPKYVNSLFEGYRKNPAHYEYCLRYENGAVWSQIIRADLVKRHGLRFQESIIHNDTRFSYLVGHHAQTVRVDPRAIYCLTYSPTSISFSLTDEKYMMRMRVIAEQMKFIEQARGGIPGSRPFPRSYLRRTLATLHRENRTQLLQQCVEILREYGLESIDREARQMIKRSDRRKNMMKIKRMILKTLRM